MADDEEQDEPYESPTLLDALKKPGLHNLPPTPLSQLRSPLQDAMERNAHLLRMADEAGKNSYANSMQNAAQELFQAQSEARQADYDRQARRDNLQAENVRLLREAHERELRRDAEQADRDRQAEARDAAQAKSKRNEIKRWVFTTSVAVGGLCVAVAGVGRAYGWF